MIELYLHVKLCPNGVVTEVVTLKAGTKI